MKITKHGHCCLSIEEKDLMILTDPGSYSTKQNELTGIDLVLITHEHADHFHVESVKKILENNPQVTIVTNSAVGKLLDKENIKYTVVADGDTFEMKGVTIEGHGIKHAEIYKTLTPVENTGYFINNRLFYPGDAFTDPKRPVDILALPAAGPWMKISEAIDYALTLKPKTVFPVHDGILTTPGISHRMLGMVLPQSGIELVILNVGGTHEF
jgi:L-ascorbate metabolism protein UlaG (beta-lactamase superfamily)